jgi:hypothetical protein
MRILLILLCFASLLSLSNVNAEVRVTVGPTTIPRGDATGAGDITISNGLFAVAFAVDTAPPWGVARGGIIDIAPLRDGEPGYDIASLADFMPNNWSSWPTTYQRVNIEKKSSDEAIIKTLRDWGEVELETIFHIKDNDSRIHIITRMTNKGRTSLEDLLSGYVVWPDGGHLFGVPGIPTLLSGPEDEALADWSASYDEHWVLGLHAPFAEFVTRYGRDRYVPHDLAAGESKKFEAWLQIENDGTLAPLVQTEIEFLQMESGQVAGRITSGDGEPVARPAVVVLKNGRTYTWTVGRDGGYEINLPSGNYDIFATAPGYAQSRSRQVTVSKDSRSNMDFNDVRPPGTLKIQVSNHYTGQPLDARISVQSGYKPLIGYHGKNTFFTELDTMGETEVSIAPGNYVFEISAGGGFTSTPQTLEIVVNSGETHALKASIPVTSMPQEHGWYSADLHHHSDVLDGFTQASFVLRSELAAGIDIAFLSDHDSVVNNNEMQILSNLRGMFFIAGTELSPSWAHFNAYPLDDGKTMDIDTGQASVQEIFAAARRMGADIIEVNHPYSEYGYFHSLELRTPGGEETSGVVPGGYDSGFDLVEITPEDNTHTIKRVWQLWNDGHKVYLAAGSDVHNVWFEESGSARTYVHIDGELSIEKFVESLKAGHAFASQGPLVYPHIIFGTEVQHKVDTMLALEYRVTAVSGLRSVQLIERGQQIEARTFEATVRPVQVDFSVRPEVDTWYSLVIEDVNGRIAYTNPVWVMVTK